MSELPAPPVDADVDLRDFAYMPLDVVRLRDSDLAALVSAEAFRAAVILWCAAWHQVPAGSLPTGDQELARLAGFGRDIAGWRKAKEGALRGFILCEDGRLYHPVIVEKARVAWDAKQAQRARTAAATAARLAKRDARNEAHDVDRNGPRDEARNDNVTSHVTPTKGEGKGKGYKKESASRSHQARDALDAFDKRFWPRYPHKVGKPAAVKAFSKLFAEMSGAIDPLLAGLERYVRTKPTDRAWMNPATFLNQRRFEDQPASGMFTPDTSSRSSSIDFGGGVVWPKSTVLMVVDKWRTDPKTWPADRIGPPPGEPGCQVPEALLQRADVDQVTTR